MQPSFVTSDTSAYQSSRHSNSNVGNLYALDAFTSQRVRVPGFNSPWYRACEQRLSQLVRLPIGWNGYRSLPVTFQVASFAANMIERLYVEGVPPPSLVPGTDGSLQVEWHRAGFDVELDVRAPKLVDCYRYEIATGAEDIITASDNFTTIFEWILALSD